MLEAGAPAKPKRFHGTVTLDPTRVRRDAGRIADEVITHLAGLVGSQIKVTLEVEAEVPSGVPDAVVRTVGPQPHRGRPTTTICERAHRLVCNVGV